MALGIAFTSKYAKTGTMSQNRYAQYAQMGQFLKHCTDIHIFNIPTLSQNRGARYAQMGNIKKE